MKFRADLGDLGKYDLAQMLSRVLGQAERGDVPIHLDPFMVLGELLSLKLSKGIGDSGYLSSSRSAETWTAESSLSDGTRR